MPTCNKELIVHGVILAGGKGRRMNYLEKPLVTLASKQMISYVIELAKPQVSQLVISANRMIDRYSEFQLPVVPDLAEGFTGPLFGIYSAMSWYKRQNISADYLACFPADVPVFPCNLVSLLLEALDEEVDGGNGTDPPMPVVWCQTGNQMQPLFSIWPFTLLPVLRQALQDGVQGPRFFFDIYPSKKIVVEPDHPVMFKNVNSTADLHAAEPLLIDYLKSLG